MTELIEYIDQQIDECIIGIHFYGLCHLIEDNNGIIPAKVATESEKVTPIDNERIVIYHRLLNGQYEPSEELSFGKSTANINAQQIRTVVFIQLDEDQSIIDDIINALPNVFEMQGYRYANVSSSINLIRDRSAIWETEYSDAYKSRFQKRFQIYALEYNLEYIKCKSCETSP